MSFMNKEESWDLFCQKAFEEQSCPVELEEAGKKIVEKCRGLPLAIVVVGGHIRMSLRTQEYWENVANHMMSILDSGENVDQLFDILYLSYSCLPVHLKPCFLYIGVFREDEVIDVSFLIELWIGEGFLKPNKNQTLEEIAEGCLNDLIDRNLILVDGRSLEGKVEMCRIHDVLRELCIKIAEKQKFFCVFDTSRSIEMEHRIVINPEEMKHVLRSAPLVRSQIAWENGCPVLFDSKLLRIVAVTEVTDKIENILRRVNLRFVRGCFELDSSISLLWNLQTLIVRNSITAPCEIWEMTQLRYLYCHKVFLPDPLPSDETNGIVLRNLQSLIGVSNLRLSDEICKRIPNIKELWMQYDDSKEQYCDEALSYYPHNLGRLHKLESLSCSIYHKGREWHEFSLALSFPSSLTKLMLWYIKLDWEEITMKIGSLPLLEVLFLGGVKGGAEWNPAEGFPRLRYLRINQCDDLTNWNAERSHFRVLQHLILDHVTDLDELACGIGEIPTLQRIDLIQCSKCLCISAVRIVVDQEDNGNDNLQLHVEFWDNEEVESFYKILQEEGLTIDNLHVSSVFG